MKCMKTSSKGSLPITGLSRVELLGCLYILWAMPSVGARARHSDTLRPLDWSGWSRQVTHGRRRIVTGCPKSVPPKRLPTLSPLDVFHARSAQRGPSM